MPTTTRSGSKRSASTLVELSAAPKKAASIDILETQHGKVPDSPWYSFFTKGDAEYDAYMANEWGFEKRGDVALFEKLSLEGAQSGLSWLTILRKREAYRKVFHGFDPVRVAAMTEVDVENILTATGNSRETIVRHKGKIKSVIHNAHCILKMRQEANDPNEQVFDKFLWSFINNKPILNRWTGEKSSAPTKSVESEEMSKQLKKKGFKFVGPTTCYSLMQSVGMVIDHPMGSPEWNAAYGRMKTRPGGYQNAGGGDDHD